MTVAARGEVQRSTCLLHLANSMSGYVESDVPAGQAACFPYCGGGDAKLLGANAPARRIEKMSFIVR